MEFKDKQVSCKSAAHLSCRLSNQVESEGTNSKQSSPTSIVVELVVQLIMLNTSLSPASSLRSIMSDQAGSDLSSVPGTINATAMAITEDKKTHRPWYSRLVSFLARGCKREQPEPSDITSVNEQPLQERQITKTKIYRLLPLDGKSGSLATRLRTGGHTFPRISPDGMISFATRTLLRLKNLVAFRNNLNISGDTNKSMIGPCDYFGSLAKVNTSPYRIKFSEAGVPAFYRCDPLLAQNLTSIDKMPPTADMMLKVDAEWLSGKDNKRELDQFFALHPNQKRPKTSLFEKPGVLKMQEEELVLPHFDATQVDLSSFKARLVKNEQPFMIAQKGKKEDPLDVVSYSFGKDYAATQIKENDGIFLETHDFSQTMTPMTPDCDGFITLARKSGENEYELIAVKVPFGYTLIVEQGCIHGDVTFSGMYMMAMTSDHRTMRTADTVFLKNMEAGKNVVVRRAEAETGSNQESMESASEIQVEISVSVPPAGVTEDFTPLGFSDFNDRCKETIKQKQPKAKYRNVVVCNPFSMLWWRYR